MNARILWKGGPNIKAGLDIAVANMYNYYQSFPYG